MYEKQLRLIDAVTAQMQICADNLEQLGENELAENLLMRIDSIKRGILQVMFVGSFGSGKSTLINAIIRRDALKTSAVPETAVITKIFFNAAEEKAVIYKRADGKISVEEMHDFEKFFSEYRIDENDREKFLRTVNHVKIFLKTSGIVGRAVQLIDSPADSLFNSDEFFLQTLKQSDAIVFMLSATSPPITYDTAFITEIFARKQMKNIFFVVNRYNQLETDEDRQKVKGRVRDELREVFLDEHGNFNQELFERRVFYVNAYGSMNTRLGSPIAPTFSIMIPDEETGVPQFEQALTEFLVTDSKIKSALKVYRSQAASAYIAAKEFVSVRLQGKLDTKERTRLQEKLQAVADSVGEINRLIYSTSL